MTTLLPPHEVDAIRSLKATAFILAVMIRLDAYHPGQAFRPEQIVPIVEMDARTVTKHLQSLSARNRVLLTRTGYVLTEGGRAMFLPASTEQAQDTHGVCVLEEGDKLINLNTDNILPPPESSAQTAQGPLSPRTILEKTDMLFKKSVLLPHDIDELDARIVLAWVAHGYDQRQTSENPNGLYAPWGLIYRRLCEGKEPRTDYRIEPAAFLPIEYLQAIGYPVPECSTVEPEVIDAPAGESDPDNPLKKWGL